MYDIDSFVVHCTNLRPYVVRCGTVASPWAMRDEHVGMVDW
jgi:hypothetical protein